jgi:lysozyme family protein
MGEKDRAEAKFNYKGGVERADSRDLRIVRVPAHRGLERSPKQLYAGIEKT